MALRCQAKPLNLFIKSEISPIGVCRCVLRVARYKCLRCGECVYGEVARRNDESNQLADFYGRLSAATGDTLRTKLGGISHYARGRYGGEFPFALV